jgi:hypothetical protein
MKKLNLTFIVIFVIALLSSFFPLLAQAQSIPDRSKESSRILKDAPLRSEESMPSVTPNLKKLYMPGPEIWSASFDPETGEVISFIDPYRKLWFNYKEGTITDLNTGEVYRLERKDNPSSKSPQQNDIKL